MDYKALAEELVKKCPEKGADAAEVYIETDRNLSLEVRKGEVETVEERLPTASGSGSSSRGKWPFPAPTTWGKKRSSTPSAGPWRSPDTTPTNNVLPDDKGMTEIAGLFDPESPGCRWRRRSNWPRERRAGHEGLAYHEERRGQVRRDRGRGRDRQLHRHVQELPVFRLLLGVSVVAEKGEQKSSGGEYCGARFFKDLKPAEEVAAKAARDAYEMLDPRMVKTQKAAVNFHADVAYATSGRDPGRRQRRTGVAGASFLGNRLDQKIGSELMTLIDDGTRRKVSLATPLTERGFRPRKGSSSTEGVLKGFMYNTIIAKRAGVKSTGMPPGVVSPTCPGSVRISSTWPPARPSPKISSRPPKPACWSRK